MKHLCPTLLFDIAVADAYGAAFEGVDDKRQAARNKLDRYHHHPTFFDHVTGTYTDDTQMSIALGEALLDERPLSELELTDESQRYIWWFIEAFRRNPRAGYTRQFYRILNSITEFNQLSYCATNHHQVAEFCSLVGGDSIKNGAAMRSVPLGVLLHPFEVMDLAELQARVTHNSVKGIYGAKAVAMMSHFAMYETKPFSSLKGYLHAFDLFLQPFDQPWEGWVGQSVEKMATDTVHAVYTLITTCRDRLEVLKQAVAFGGDTDTVAAIAFGIFSIRDQTPLPQALIDGLEAGPYGSGYLLELGHRLMTKYHQ